MNVGDLLELDIEGVAHGGHFVARHEGRVIFVRHAISGEKVRARITSMTSSFARADCIEVLRTSNDRVTPPCKFAHADGCGGCDFQHISLAAQRRFKADVIKEQFARIAKLNIEVDVEEVEPTMHWRSRMEFVVSPDRRLAMHQHRSHNLIEIDNCLIAESRIDIASINAVKLPRGARVDVAAGANKVARVIEGRENFDLIEEEVNGRKFQLNPITFWQSHVKAPSLLANIVREMAQVKPDDQIADLYGGAGLFTGEFLSHLKNEGKIILIDSDVNAMTDARRNFATDDRVTIIESRVEKALTSHRADLEGSDIVILDPPRSGAGAKVLDSVISLDPRVIIYVACDPASLARDSRHLLDKGYEISLRAFDLFPMTHHIECVARFIKAS